MDKQQENIIQLAANVKADFDRAPAFVKSYLLSSVAFAQAVAAEMVASRARLTIIERDHLKM